MSLLDESSVEMEEKFPNFQGIVQQSCLHHIVESGQKWFFVNTTTIHLPDRTATSLTY